MLSLSIILALLQFHWNCHVRNMFTYSVALKVSIQNNCTLLVFKLCILATVLLLVLLCYFVVFLATPIEQFSHDDGH